MPTVLIWGMLICAGLLGLPCSAKQQIKPQNETHKQYIQNHYAEQLTSPEKKKRLSFAQFGYGLSYFPFPLFPITGFIDPDNFGEHSYSKPSPKERNGSLYTCKGGFIDFSHLRAAIDWTAYISFKIICGNEDMDLPVSDGSMKLELKKNIQHLPLEDIVSIAQKIAYERLTWHEICSWYYHLPNYTFNEQQSTFTPEDTYSNFLGTVIGRNIVLRILQKQEGLSFEQIATEEIKLYITKLLPVDSKKQSMAAYDIVDATKQAKLPPAKRNKDVWWDSEVIFTDERYVFKRYMHIGPALTPWLVPRAESVGCNAKPEVLYVPQKTKAGISLYEYYTLSISPDSLMFFDKKNNQLHKPFGTFTSDNMQKIMDHLSVEMREGLLAGFNRRNKVNPEKKYDNLKRSWFSRKKKYNNQN